MWLIDTSVAVPLVLTSHEAHSTTAQRLGDRAVRLPAHAALETYSVLTRLPGDARVEAVDAATLLADRFGLPITLDNDLLAQLVHELAAVGISGGAVYDALIAVTAREASATLLSRDRRATATYALLGATVELV